MSKADLPIPAVPSDGRRARGDRTRVAIVDALLALVAEGQLRPPAERVAERAGISRRALFNHFTDVDDLLACAADRRIEQVLPTLRPLPMEGSLPARAAGVSANLCALHERVAPVRRAALLAEAESKVIRERLAAARRLHRTAVLSAFARELAEYNESEREEKSALLAAVTGFAFWDELTARQGLAPARAEEAVRKQILATLRPRARS